MTDDTKDEEMQPLAEPEAEAPCDERGRWRKGYCPNPQGRPRKRAHPKNDPSDVRHFMNTQVELMVGGEVQKMDRKAALLSKMFESAMKGRVSMQRHLMNMFDKNEAELSEFRQQYNLYLHEWIIDNPDFETIEDSLTHHQWSTLLMMATTLNHYHPGQFDELLPKTRPQEDR